MKKLYFVVEVSSYGEGTSNGLRTITVYTIENNKPRIWFELECLSDDLGFYFSNEEEIQEWLNDNGYGDAEIEMIQL